MPHFNTHSIRAQMGESEREGESGALPSFLLSFPQIVCKHLAFRPFSSFSFHCGASTLSVGVTNESPWSRVAVTPARPLPPVVGQDDLFARGSAS